MLIFLWSLGCCYCGRNVCEEQNSPLAGDCDSHSCGLLLKDSEAPWFLLWLRMPQLWFMEKKFDFHIFLSTTCTLFSSMNEKKNKSSGCFFIFLKCQATGYPQKVAVPSAGMVSVVAMTVTGRIITPRWGACKLKEASCRVWLIEKVIFSLVRKSVSSSSTCPLLGSQGLKPSSK